MAESRKNILERFHTKMSAGRPIIGGGAGTGISAKWEEAGGIDLIVIYNSGRFRMAGHGSLLSHRLLLFQWNGSLQGIVLIPTFAVFPQLPWIQ